MRNIVFVNIDYNDYSLLGLYDTYEKAYERLLQLRGTHIMRYIFNDIGDCINLPLYSHTIDSKDVFT